MTRQEIIELTLQQVEYRRCSTPEGIEANDEIVIPELDRRLPEGDIKTCEDFKYLNVECCDTCHTFYPHYDMYLVTLPDCSRAWICCTVRSAVLGLKEPSEEEIRGLFGGKIRE
jgi:hypothetical protein